MKKKERLDVVLVDRGMIETRSKAKILIMEGKVFVNGQREDKAGTLVPLDALIELKGQKLKYVSRGGYKLEKAIDVWKLDLTGRVCLDIGASTGGFTDCMLQNGAAKVYAIDVGTNQLAWTLRNDERVVSMEKTNFRYVTPADIPEKVDFASADVAFISLDKILGPAYALLKDNGTMAALIKPQFEAGREEVGKHGVVRDVQVQADVIKRVTEFARAAGFKVLGLDYSPIRGPEGNIEFLLYITKDRSAADVIYSDEETALLVERAHAELEAKNDN
ncbi:MAG: TlyA family RNA methyltransferase [Lachnospiraceae bacterium]|nr:TlyA family RNA methyltransferase [Lachnospiraceae bacterium]MEE3461003.1 TlyA family RNA methyltransferase [Lachnospiraceae bacterium]